MYLLRNSPARVQLTRTRCTINKVCSCIMGGSNMSSRRK